MSKQSFIFFVVGTVISVFALISTLCFYRNRRRRRAISPYSTLTRDGKIAVNEKGVTMLPARDLLFPTQSHNKATYNSKDADIPTWDRKTQVERHSSVRLPKNAVKKWGNERESNRNSKTKQWLEGLEQQRDQRKQWLDGIEQKREARKSWIVNISPRSTDVSVLPSSPTTREQRRSKLLSSLKQRETNPDADKGEVKETMRNSNRKSWNPELARRESGKSLTRSQRKSYRASMIEGDKRLEREINGNEEDKAIESERERAYVAQPAKKQTLFGEGGAMWETVLERV
ncbi:5106_t:CDS:1 [Paraglomus brasilianum]|uniref:5106_t:CDS:1 n=1 Tax=Paraglomus brasilianum TaxID=144538 RepID=A0A9N8VP58_9GLOM|nr:5106_t:CDS:1 [Paraglomus brasilianum]